MSTTQTTTYFDFLQGKNFVSLKTFRKSGEGVATPVWFAQEGEKLYVVTRTNSGKVKRIRNNAQVEVTPCDARGGLLGQDYRPAVARILPDGPQSKAAHGALSRKYGWQLAMFAIMWRIRRIPNSFLEITPA